MRVGRHHCPQHAPVAVNVHDVKGINKQAKENYCTLHGALLTIHKYTLTLLDLKINSQFSHNKKVGLSRLLGKD